MIKNALRLTSTLLLAQLAGFIAASTGTPLAPAGDLTPAAALGSAFQEASAADAPPRPHASPNEFTAAAAAGRPLGPGEAQVISLSQPAGSFRLTGAGVHAQLTADGMAVYLTPDQYRQGERLPYELVPVNRWGVDGVTYRGELDTLPALTATLDPNGIVNLGLALPVSIHFNYPPADRSQVQAQFQLSVRDSSLTPVDPGAGRWQWASDTEAQYFPNPAWKTHTLYHAEMRLDGLRGAFGDSADPGVVVTEFATGANREIDVDLSTQTLTALEDGVVVNQFLIASGTLRHPTVTGHFYIYRRVADEHMVSPEGPGSPDYYNLYHVPWTQYFYQGFALHGAWWHNNFGHPMSHGCVNVSSPAFNTRWPNAAPDAEWLWTWANLGTPVVVSGTTPAS
ncbi:MAG: L,D-transpeptidase [Candidatus Dormibacteria bacterium]